MKNDVLLILAVVLAILSYLVVFEDIPLSATLSDARTMTYQDRGLLP